ncbi:hypothetical protein OCK74_25075 [Chitinophagaceae bacterium LB-8]|uniref:Uncharacterized protein n=1 Tax=Paraflavisolibacter caeni TaxID=2982496 RepID=A0A9X2XZQ4_9BACT|nr:hypothetical protein [Paraflavisolibacter caeni]MCU7552416.1 hypothetical protein [Paraflavisolibacter caeni]
MQKIFLLLITASLLLASCDRYGKKVEINNNSEVFYKDEATESEAKRLGNFLLDRNFFDSQNEKSVQLSKDSGIYTVRFVVDKASYETDKENTLLGFRVWQMWISEDVFNMAKTKVVLVDDQFNDLADAGELTPELKAAVRAEQLNSITPDAGATTPDSSRMDNTRVE